MIAPAGALPQTAGRDDAVVRFTLLCLAARRQADPGRVAELRELAHSGEVDWEDCQALAETEKLEPLLFAFLAGQGNGGWADPVLFLAGVQPSGIGAADFNGDGKLDVAVSHAGEDNVSVFLGDGGGAFATGLTIAVGSHPTHLLVQDFNADGRPDVAVANTGDRTLSFLRGKGDGTFEPVQTYRTSAAPTRMAAGDLSGSGYEDLVVGPDGEVFRNSLNPGVYLSVAPAGDDLVFEWPALATGYSLISSARVGPAAVWAPVPTPPITEGDLNKVVVVRPGAETFYRLRK